MPAYTFEIVNPAGEILAELQLTLPVAGRDAVTLRRKTVPDSVAVSGAARNPGETRRQVLEAYRRIEQRHGNTGALRQRLGHTPEQIRRAWGPRD